MKRIISMITVLTIIMSISVPVYAAPTASIMFTENEWITSNGYEYPLTPANSEWASLSYAEQLSACDMPIDMLSSCTTEELVNLALEYPFLIDILAFDNAELAIRHLINSSNIFEEFFSRDNITNLLLEKYDEIDVDYEELQNTTNKTAFTDSGYVAELFLQTYFAQVIHSLSDAQAKDLSRIIGEKYEEKKGICDDFATSLLIYDFVQRGNETIPQNIVPEDIKTELISKGNLLIIGEVETDSDQNRATSGFTSSGIIVQTEDGTNYTYGTYTLYGKTEKCLRFYSNDFTSSEATILNNSFDSAHSSWSRVSTCTKKYNCHSYTWINSSSSNIYWLNNPDTFANSSAFTFVGHSVNKSPISGDKIIIKSSMSFDDGFGNITYSLHSANVISSSGSTRSKLGSCGVYIVPINELVRFYDGFFYNIYR